MNRHLRGPARGDTQFPVLAAAVELRPRLAFLSLDLRPVSMADSPVRHRLLTVIDLLQVIQTSN
jgi:hypothetical protein